MPPKKDNPRKQGERPTPSLYKMTRDYTAKHLKLNDLKEDGDYKVPKEVYKDVKHKMVKKAYDRHVRANSSEDVKQWRKSTFRDNYKTRRANAVGFVDKETKQKVKGDPQLYKIMKEKAKA